MSFADRIAKSSTYIGITPKKLEELLKKQGIDSIDVLNANTTTLLDIASAMTDFPFLKAKMAAAILKGDNPLEEKKEDTSETSMLADLIKSQRPVEQWSDQEVLEAYIADQDEMYERNLQLRSKNRPFIILEKGSNDKIDIKATLMMLKRARKEDIPKQIKTPDGFIRIYKVEEFTVGNRVRYESPLRPGSILFDGYCSQCKQNFSNVCEEERIVLRLIYEQEGQMSRSEETKLVKLAEQGMDFLIEDYGDVYIKYQNLKLREELPKLKIIAPLETKADPFKPGSGHRVY